MDKEQILKIIDKCFHMFAIDFRNEAKKEAEKMIENMRNLEPTLEQGNDFISDVSARLYSLKLNETLHADMKWGVRTDITRVPGG